MHNGPSVIVKKGGFFSALAYGVFGTLSAAIVCGSGLAIYGMNIVDRKASQVLHFGTGVIGNLPDIAEALPPVLSDALSDRRDPKYREHVDASVRILSADEDERPRLVVEVVNNGPETITLMSARVSLEDEDGIPLREVTTYVATPMAFDEGEWRGPLMPGSTRRFAYRLRRPVPERASLEITELRVWDERVSTTGERP